MPKRSNRNESDFPVRSLAALLGHTSGTNTPEPVKQLHDAVQNIGGKKPKGGPKFSAGSDVRTKMNIPQGKAKKSMAKRLNPYGKG